MVVAVRHLASALAVFGLSALLASQAAAQTPQAPKDAEVTEVDEVVVLGLPLAEQVERFVD